MRVYIDDMTLRNFEAWSGAISTKERIISEGKSEDFDYLIDELYPNGLSETQLNDILWFESDWVFKNLGISNDEEEHEDK